MKYEIVIIGGGLGGLVCGAVLSKEGYHVCVVEKNPLPGGCFQSFRRFGKTLDTGIHYIGSMDEGQIMNQYFTYFGIRDSLKMMRMDPDAFDIIRYDGREYPYAMGHAHFADTLSHYFPSEKDAIRHYVRLLEETGRTISVEELKKGHLSTGNMDKFYHSAWQQIRDITPDETLRQVLSGSILLYGGVKQASTFYHHAIITDSYIQSAYRFVDGSMQVTNALAEQIGRHGGTVLTKAEATGIRLSGGQVEAVEINRSERIETKALISSLHPYRTLAMVEKTPLIRKATLSRLRYLPNSYGLLSVYLLQKKRMTTYKNRNIFILGDKDAWYTPRPEEKRINACMISMQPSSTSVGYTDVICLLTPMYMEEVRRWEGTKPEQRGDDYKAFKENKAQDLIAFAESRYPGLTRNTEEIVVTTPLSYRDYTGTPDGSAYGIIKDYANPMTTLIPVRTRIPNLYLTGQNLNVHGALGVTLTSMLTCSEFLGMEYLAKKAGNA